MKQTVWFLLLLAPCCSLLAQKPVRPVRPIVTADVTRQQVVLFENPNFTGASRSFGPGQYVLNDFNDMASSVRVPAGMVALLYEHAAPGSGYGISVDLLENTADLSTLNFNKKLSYLSVFYSTRDNTYEWARNKMVNGQFVPGHWERKKARPGPANPVAIVSPPIPSPLPAGPTQLASNGPNTSIVSLGVQSTESRALWERAMQQQLGVIGNDYRGIEELGSACFERASNNPLIPDFLNFWYLQKQKNDHRSVVYFKRTLTGTISRVHQVNISGTFEDYDVNIDILPDPAFQYLLTDAVTPDHTGLMKSQYYGSLGYSGESGCPGSFTSLEAEIADKFRPGDGYRSRLIDMNENRVGKKISVYGPWIWDEGHCRHPEIHPAEQLWWSEPVGNGRTLNLNVICDASRRYWWRSQMDDGSKKNPWAEPPIKGLFAIAFEYELPGLSPAAATGYSSKQFEVSNIQHYNVIEYPGADQVYNLVYEGKNIVSFIPHNNAFKVSFEHVGISPDNRNRIRGFLVIETSVGLTTQVSTSVTYPGSNPPVRYPVPEGTRPGSVPEILERSVFKKEEGLYYFQLTEKNISKGRAEVISGIQRP